jgi:hypothetical protein
MPAPFAVSLTDASPDDSTSSLPDRRFALVAIALAAIAAVLPGNALRAKEVERPSTNSVNTQIAAEAAAHCPLGCTATSRCRPQDRRWVVSTREIDCVAAGDTPALVFYVQDGAGQWQTSDLASFVAAVGATRARFWVHGYKVDPDKAVAMGAAAHDALVDAGEPPLQFVIWSWPAEREGLQIPDIRRKACRTITEAYCLAWLWRQLDHNAELSIAGYSYGARIITGGLHIAAGGTICDLALAADDRQPTSHVRTVLFAAGVDHDALAENGFHGRALIASEALLSIYTSTDRVLRWYHVAVNDRTATALGYVGIAPLPPPEGSDGKFSQMDVSSEIGGVHDWEAYLGNAKVTTAARDALAHRMKEPSATDAATQAATIKSASSRKRATKGQAAKAAAITPMRAAARIDAMQRAAGTAR